MVLPSGKRVAYKRKVDKRIYNVLNVQCGFGKKAYVFKKHASPLGSPPRLQEAYNQG